MSGRRSVDKGKAREREVLQLVRERAPWASRTGHQQGEGGEHRKPDIDMGRGVWLSVKGGKAPRVLDAVVEAADAADDRIPIVAFRRDGWGSWWAALPLEDLLSFLDRDSILGKP